MNKNRPKKPRTIEAFAAWLNHVDKPLSVSAIAQETGLTPAVVLTWLPKAGFELEGYNARTFDVRKTYTLKEITLKDRLKGAPSDSQKQQPVKTKKSSITKN